MIKFPLKRGVTTIQHENAIKSYILSYGGIPSYIKNNSSKIQRYFPDVINNDQNVEIEVFPRSSYFKLKKIKWGTNPKTLVIVIGETAYVDFQEILLYDNNHFTKIK